jgi:hypothetical protein
MAVTGAGVADVAAMLFGMSVLVTFTIVVEVAVVSAFVLVLFSSVGMTRGTRVVRFSSMGMTGGTRVVGAVEADGMTVVSGMAAVVAKALVAFVAVVFVICLSSASFRGDRTAMGSARGAVVEVAVELLNVMIKPRPDSCSSSRACLVLVLILLPIPMVVVLPLAVVVVVVVVVA